MYRISLCTTNIDKMERNMIACLDTITFQEMEHPAQLLHLAMSNALFPFFFLTKM